MLVLCCWLCAYHVLCTYRVLPARSSVLMMCTNNTNWFRVHCVHTGVQYDDSRLGQPPCQLSSRRGGGGGGAPCHLRFGGHDARFRPPLARSSAETEAGRHHRIWKQRRSSHRQACDFFCSGRPCTAGATATAAVAAETWAVSGSCSEAFNCGISDGACDGVRIHSRSRGDLDNMTGLVGVLKIRLTINLGFICILTQLFICSDSSHCAFPESGGGVPGGSHVRR